MSIEKARIKVARELARKLYEKAGIKTLPVLLKDVVSSLDITVAKWSFDEDISGVQLSDGEESFIGYNETHPTVRQRATVAHEIGHFVLKHTDVNNLDRLEYENDQVKENEAWYFARELLMPIKEFKEEFEKNNNAAYLAWRFWVSKDMVFIRISELGLLNKIPL